MLRRQQNVLSKWGSLMCIPDSPPTRTHFPYTQQTRCINHTHNFRHCSWGTERKKCAEFLESHCNDYSWKCLCEHSRVQIRTRLTRTQKLQLRHRSASMISFLHTPLDVYWEKTILISFTRLGCFKWMTKCSRKKTKICFIGENM